MRTLRRIGTRGIEGKLGLMTVIVVAFAVVAATGQQPAGAASTPLLSNQASASQVSVLDPIFDTATLGNGLLPTGALTFKLFGPNNATCAGTPIFTTATVVAGNGYYQSARYTPSAVGTYRWIAVYGGDLLNTASAPTLCSDPAAQMVVSPKTPTFRAAPSTVQPTSADTAVLTMGANPGGTITFKLYGPNNPTCAGVPVFTSVRPVAGNGSYTSATVVGLPLGTYRWVAAYSGDANNLARATACSEIGNGFTLAPAAVGGEREPGDREPGRHRHRLLVGRGDTHHRRLDRAVQGRDPGGRCGDGLEVHLGHGRRVDDDQAPLGRHGPVRGAPHGQQHDQAPGRSRPRHRPGVAQPTSSQPTEPPRPPRGGCDASANRWVQVGPGGSTRGRRPRALTDSGPGCSRDRHTTRLDPSSISCWDSVDFLRVTRWGGLRHPASPLWGGPF